MKFKHYFMEDALEDIIDYRGKTPHKATSGIPTLSAKSVKDGYIDYSNCYFISLEEYYRFMVRGIPKTGDVLLTTEAPLGNVARLDKEDIALAQRVLALRGKQGVLDTGFLYYYLRSPIGQAKLIEKETGTTVTGIKQSEFRRIEIDIPSYAVQKKIVDILGHLDQKIRLNRKINKNLAA
jgi:type I restriction enzyme S subunit